MRINSMRTTINIPKHLIEEAMKLTNIRTKTDVIKEALMILIQREKIKDIKSYRGKIQIDINLDKLRKR
jgi:hypothetical protein